MLKKFKELLLVGLAVCCMGYAGYTLVDPPAKASAAVCCSAGAQCGQYELCCIPDACTEPCSPPPRRGYCLPQCPIPC